MLMEGHPPKTTKRGFGAEDAKSNRLALLLFVVQW